MYLQVFEFVKISTIQVVDVLSSVIYVLVFVCTHKDKIILSIFETTV